MLHYTRSPAPDLALTDNVSIVTLCRGPQKKTKIRDFSITGNRTLGAGVRDPNVTNYTMTDVPRKQEVNTCTYLLVSKFAIHLIHDTVKWVFV